MWTTFTPPAAELSRSCRGRLSHRRSHFFAKLTRRRLKHGVFKSEVDLQAAINRFIAEYNATDPKPFTWKAKPDDIIAARKRGFQMLESINWTRADGAYHR